MKAAPKKNCHSCKHLEWVEGDNESETGWDCNKRHEKMFERGQERVLLQNLDSDAYRNRYKRCFELKEQPA